MRIFSGALLLGCVLVFMGCSSTASSGSTGTTTGQTSKAASKNQRNTPLFSGDGGKGMVIAVPAPSMRDSTRADNWMPQLFQDTITGDLARYSAMTVIDRANEKLTLAGAILSGHDGRRGYIYHTAVAEAYRGQGLGTVLVSAVEQALRGEGITKIALVAFKGNEAGNRFWEKQGFTIREDLVYRNKQLL